MPFRFVHAADIHLDSPLRSLALRDPELAALIGTATRRAFSAIIDLCLDEQVDALLLAGDLYDGEQTSMKTARFLATEMARLDRAGIRAFIIRGNHDSLAQITKELVLPESVKIFSGRAEAVRVTARQGGVEVAIHGISFAQRHAPDSLLPKYKPPVPGLPNIGLMHTSLAGAPGHDLYAPCSVADLMASGFDYWALGHIHKRIDPPPGPVKIVMPGMPQGRDVNEEGAKSVTLVTIAEDRSIALEARPTSIAAFERVSVPLDGIAEQRAMAAAITAALERRRSETKAEHLVARLVLTGVTPLARAIRRDPDFVKTEAAHRAGLIGRTWVEKIEIDCRMPLAATGPVADPLLELRGLIESEIAPSEAFRDRIAGMADELRRQLPLDCHGLFGEDEAGARAMLDRLLAEGTEDVLALLQARGPAEEG
jgi:DNA repair exonuclease SbcCD nuclease subunit